MQLPIIWPDLPGQNFECRGCTRCCRELVVHLTRADREKIDRQKWGGRIEAEPYIRLGRSYVLNHKPGGGCVFLADDNQCRIHADFGATEKPLACQLYPFTLDSGASGLHVGLRFDCPTTASSGGRPLAAHKRDVIKLAEALSAAGAIDATRAVLSQEVAQGARIPAAVAGQFTAEIVRWLRGGGISLWNRLFGVHRLAVTLSEAKFKRLDADSAAELVVMLAGGIRELAVESWNEPPAVLTSRAMRLFRHTVFSHCEHVTVDQIKTPLPKALAYRLGQLRRARRMARGNGHVPELRGISATPEFVRIENMNPANDLDQRAVESLLVRYLLARFEGGTVFGPGYYGWSIVDGVSALALAVATAGWLTRCIAAADQRGAFELRDIEQALGIVDRSAGRVPELGAGSARLRVRYLLEADALPALLRRYSLTSLD